MDFQQYEKHVINYETQAGSDKLELTDTTETEQKMIAEVLGKVLYKLVLICIEFGIDFDQIADVSLAGRKWELRNGKY